MEVFKQEPIASTVLMPNCKSNFVGSLSYVTFLKTKIPKHIPLQQLTY